MARSKNQLLKDVSGAIGNQLIVKQYSYGTVVTRRPDMSKIKPSREQTQKRSVFKEAVAYAQSILRDPKAIAVYKKGLKKGQTVYHKAIREYLNKNKGTK